MMTEQELMTVIQRAADAVRVRSSAEWRVMIVLGSGLGALADDVESAVRIPYAEIPGFAASTVPGHSGAFLIGKLYGVPVAVMQGRSHFYEGYPPWQITLPVRVASTLGAQTMIISNAAGGINRRYAVGDVMMMTDHINLIDMLGNNPLVGPNLSAFGPRFPSMTEAHDPALRELALRAATDAGVKL